MYQGKVLTKIVLTVKALCGNAIFSWLHNFLDKQYSTVIFEKTRNTGLTLKVLGLEIESTAVLYRPERKRTTVDLDLFFHSLEV